jgi:hypothetical protein
MARPKNGGKFSGELAKPLPRSAQDRDHHRHLRIRLLFAHYGIRDPYSSARRPRNALAALAAGEAKGLGAIEPEVEPWEALARRLASEFVPGLREDNRPGRDGLRDWSAVMPKELITLAHFMCRHPHLSATHAIRRWAKTPEYPFTGATAATADKKTRELRNRMIAQAQSEAPSVSTFGEAMRVLARRSARIYPSLVMEARVSVWEAEEKLSELEADSPETTRAIAEAKLGAAREKLKILEQSQREVDAAWAGFPPADER